MVQWVLWAVGAVVSLLLADIVMVRQSNEDAYFVDVRGGLFIVSDGMGGHQAGDLASKAVVEILPRMIKQRFAELANMTRTSIRNVLRDAIADLSSELHLSSRDQAGLKGMGATVVLALVKNDRVYIAHLGDSRAYILRRNHLARLTNDHNVADILLRRGEITWREAKCHPARSQLTQHMGMEGYAHPGVRSFALKEGDRILLCSDGLNCMLTNREIGDVLRTHQHVADAVEALVKKANDAGGIDNVTALMIGVE